MPGKPPPSPWVTSPKPRPNPSLRLFCLPFSGAGASSFLPWSADLPETIEVCPIQLPGRETRMREAPFQRLTPLVKALATEITPWLDMPFAFFGHSLGALIAHELTRELRRQNRPGPLHLFASGRRAPHLVDPDPLHRLPDPAFIARLRRMEGTPEAILREPELLALFLPILRADLAVNEAEAHVPEAPLDCPITAYGGLTDERVPRDGLEAWRQHTTGPFSIEMFPGGHFFLKSARVDLLRSIARSLTR